MQHPSVSWHIIPLKVSNWNIKCFGQKEPINVQFSEFWVLTELKVHPIRHAIFETTKSSFIQILHHFSLSCEITPLCFFSSNLIYIGTKTVHRSELFELLSDWVKFTKLLMSYLKPQVTFSLNFESLFNVSGGQSSVLF